jgi:hypothetical protein
MADESDVETALVGLIGAALYPNGLVGACAVNGAVCRIYRGWPVTAALDADLAAGITNVSLTTVPGQSRNTSRWPDTWIPQSTIAASLTASVIGQSVTFGGTGGAGQIAAVIADAAWASWRLQASDTPQSVASNLATSLSNARPATAVGTSLTVPGAARLIARVEADQPSLRLARRQKQAFRVTAWCADPATRDSVGSALDSALAGVDFLGLADGTSGRLRYIATSLSDRWEDATLYRRELTYTVDYSTTIAVDLPRMAVGALNATLGADPIPETLLN